MKESATTSHVRLTAAQLGVFLWRNNSGGFYDEQGRFVRYGLGNFTEKDGIKSSDFIGGKPVLITPDMVGKTLLVFTAVEMKPSDWKFYASDKRTLAQQKFIDIVNSAGGYAGFARNNDDFLRIIKHER